MFCLEKGNVTIFLNGTEYSRMDQVKYVEETFKKSEGIWHIPSNLLKAIFHKFYLVHSSILCPI